MHAKKKTRFPKDEYNNDYDDDDDGGYSIKNQHKFAHPNN